MTIAAAAAILAVSCGSSSPLPPVALMVVPHPDDELGATAIIEPLEAAGYELMMLLVTDGEATRRCDTDQGTDACRTRRVDAWEQVADVLGVGATQRLRAQIPDRAATVPVVTEAICAAIATIEASGRNVTMLIAASYFGGDGDTAVVYEHPDHDATNEAVIGQRCAAVPRLVRIPADEDPELVLNVSEDTYARLLGDGGIAQHAYGWLAFDFVTGDQLEAWTMSDDDRTSPFSREQGFACWDAPGVERDRRHCVLR